MEITDVASCKEPVTFLDLSVMRHTGILRVGELILQLIVDYVDSAGWAPKET